MREPAHRSTRPHHTIGVTGQDNIQLDFTAIDARWNQACEGDDDEAQPQRSVIVVNTCYALDGA